MGAVYFYHLTNATLDETLPMLLGKARGAGWRILVRSPDTALLDRLDTFLWESSKDGFLPHGRSGGVHDHEQPILLAESVEDSAFECLICIGGDDINPDEINAHERSCIVFDGYDGAALEKARNQWKVLTDAGCKAQYWAQDDGRWTMKAEAG